MYITILYFKTEKTQQKPQNQKNLMQIFNVYKAMSHFDAIFWRVRQTERQNTHFLILIQKTKRLPVHPINISKATHWHGPPGNHPCNTHMINRDIIFHETADVLVDGWMTLWMRLLELVYCSIVSCSDYFICHHHLSTNL